jgi:hypothetical protein
VVVVLVEVVADLLFSEYNMVWRSFLWARGSGCKVLILLGPLFLPSVAPSSQQGFGVMELTLSGSGPSQHLGST